ARLGRSLDRAATALEVDELELDLALPVGELAVPVVLARNRARAPRRMQQLDRRQTLRQRCAECAMAPSIAVEHVALLEAVGSDGRREGLRDRPGEARQARDLVFLGHRPALTPLQRSAPIDTIPRGAQR